MNIYVIDTRRCKAWRSAFPVGADRMLEFAHEVNDQKPPTFDSGDFVFAHAHEDETSDHPDFPIAGWKNRYTCSEKIQVFVTYLRDAPADCKPIVILYSGGDLNENTRQAWTAAAIGLDGPLEGYPVDRIRFYSGVVDPCATETSLRSLVDGVIGFLGSKEEISTSINIAWLEEAKLAAQLFVEADNLRIDECNGIKIVKPSAELVQLAKQVINQSGNGQDLATAAEALCQKLASRKE